MHGRRLSLAACPLLLGLLISPALTGCGPQGAPPEPPEATPLAEPPPPKRIDRRLMAIADEIDPGEVEPLLKSLPAWLEKALKAELVAGEAPAATLARARADREAWESAKTGPEPADLARLGRALYLTEHLVLTGEAVDSELLSELERLYSLLDLPFFTSEEGFFREMLGIVVRAAAQDGLLSDQQQVQELVGFIREATRRAGPLKRRTAARLLRDHPYRPEIPRVLRDLANDAARREDFAGAVKLSQLALDRTREPSEDELLTHAKRCYLALDVEAGDRFREQAATAATATADDNDDKAEDRLAELTRTRAQVVELVGLADAEELDDRLRRAHLLVELGRFDEATRVYGELKDAHPEDARPYVGLTKIAISRDLQISGDLPIRQARDLENRDREYYEVSLGLTSGRLLTQVIPAATQEGSDVDGIVGAFLDETRADIEGWATYEPARAAVLLAVTEVLRAALPKALQGEQGGTKQSLRKMVGEFDRIRRAHPETREAWEATYVAALFAKTRKIAWTTVSQPLPEAFSNDHELHERRLHALQNLIFLWEPGDPIADFEALLASVPEPLRSEPFAAEAAALLDYLRLRAGEPGAGTQALATYTALASQRSGSARGHALANLGVLRSLTGDPAGAIAAWEEAITLVDDLGRDIIYLNAAIQDLGPQAAQSLETLTTSTQNALIRLQAAAWRAELVARGGDDPSAAIAAYRAAVTDERTRELRANLPLGGLGVLSTGSFTFNLGYEFGPKGDGLRIDLAVDATPWLVPAAPLTIPAAAKRSSRKTTQKPANQKPAKKSAG